MNVVAASNTERGRETCGLLLGKLVRISSSRFPPPLFPLSNQRRKGTEADETNNTQSHNTLSITTLLIPKQIGSADTCETTHEEEQFAFQDERGLLTLGWVRFPFLLFFVVVGRSVRS